MGRIEIELSDDLEGKIRSSGIKADDLISQLLLSYFRRSEHKPSQGELHRRERSAEDQQETISRETKESNLEMNKRRQDAKWEEQTKEEPLTEIGSAISEEIKRSERNIQRLESTSKWAHEVSEKTEQITRSAEATADKAHMRRRAADKSAKAEVKGEIKSEAKDEAPLGKAEEKKAD